MSQYGSFILYIPHMFHLRKKNGLFAKPVKIRACSLKTVAERLRGCLLGCMCRQGESFSTSVVSHVQRGSPRALIQHTRQAALHQIAHVGKYTGKGFRGFCFRVQSCFYHNILKIFELHEWSLTVSFPLVSVISSFHHHRCIHPYGKLTGMLNVERKLSLSLFFGQRRLGGFMTNYAN